MLYSDKSSGSSGRPSTPMTRHDRIAEAKRMRSSGASFRAIAKRLDVSPGTIVNWVDTLVEWNDGLDPELASELFGSMFDFPMPSDYPVSSYNGEATDEWFTTSVRDQTARMIANSGGQERYMPWVGLEHFGSNWLTPSELSRLLAEMQAQGATRYCYFIYNSMKPEIWDVIRSFSRG